MPTSAIHIDTNSTTMENRFIVKAICYLLYFPRRKNDNLIIIVCGIEMYDRELLQINTPKLAASMCDVCAWINKKPEFIRIRLFLHEMGFTEASSNMVVDT